MTTTNENDDAVVDLGLPDHNYSDSVADALALVNTAKNMVAVLDAPDTVGSPDTRLQGSGRSYFPRFLAAFEAMCAALKPGHRKLQSCSVRYLSSAQRLALKALLHEEVKALAEAARAQATVTPKQFGGAAHPLPAHHIECESGVDALMEETHAQIQALNARMRMLREAHETLKRMRGNVEAAEALARADVAASFAASPLPSSDASAEAGNNNIHKRAKK
jgi:hypothetical protein